MYVYFVPERSLHITVPLPTQTCSPPPPDIRLFPGSPLHCTAHSSLPSTTVPYRGALCILEPFLLKYILELACQASQKSL